MSKKLKREVCMSDSERNEHTSFLYLSLKNQKDKLWFFKNKREMNPIRIIYGV